MNNDFNKSIKTRFAYIDNVRLLVIVLVIAMHSAVTYSGMGGWYYVEGSRRSLSFLEFAFFGFFQSFLQAWFMGILFFISAYFAAKALAKHGSFNFIKERLFRLGLPLLIYIFIITPFIMVVLLGYKYKKSFIEDYIQYIVDFSWLSSTGPLWFVQVLLFFCIIYTIVKKINSKVVKLYNVKSFHIISTIIITTVIAFLVRIKIPIGSSFLNLQFAYFPSYVVMFITGLIIGENDLLENIANERNIKWLKLTLIIGIPFWAIIMILEGASGRDQGGLHWENFAFALWESFIAIGFSIGLIAFFKKKLNINNKLTILIRDNAFGMYCFHAPILIVVSLVIKHLILNPILKFLIAFIFASVLCFIFTLFIRKIKPIRKLFN